MLSEEFKNKVSRIIKESCEEYKMYNDIDILLLDIIGDSFDRMFSKEESDYIYEQVHNSRNIQSDNFEKYQTSKASA